MARSLEEIEDMLAALPAQEFRFDMVKEDALTYVGAIRTDAGQNVIEPAPESASMIHAFKPVIDFLVAAPEIVRQLLDKVEDLSADAKTEGPPPPPDPASRPIVAPRPPRGREVS